MISRSGRLAILVAVVVSIGADAAYARDYGAIAYSPSTRMWAYSNSSTSQRSAEREAQNRCAAAAKASDCTIVTWFYHACGALTVSPDGVYAAAWANEHEDAEAAAIKSCRTAATGCVSETWACSYRPYGGTSRNNSQGGWRVPPPNLGIGPTGVPCIYPGSHC